MTTETDLIRLGADAAKLAGTINPDLSGERAVERIGFETARLRLDGNAIRLGLMTIAATCLVAVAAYDRRQATAVACGALRPRPLPAGFLRRSLALVCSDKAGVQNPGEGER